MTTAGLFTTISAQPRISFELYPPRTPKGEARLRTTVHDLAAARPEFFSITYGAAGKTHDTSLELIRQILADTDIIPLAHLTCVGASREELRGIITELLTDGVRDFLALRGDPPQRTEGWVPHPAGLTRAADLVELIREIEADTFPLGPGRPRPLSVSAAAYPSGSYDGVDQAQTRDIQALQAKQAAGADYAITQLFYSAQEYATHVARAREAGVHLPILPGFIPLTSLRRLQRLADLTGVPVPEELEQRLSSAADDQEQYRIGLDASVTLMREILDAGAPGAHIYTFNSSRAALDLLAETGLRPRVPTSPAPVAARATAHS